MSRKARRARQYATPANTLAPSAQDVAAELYKMIQGNLTNRPIATDATGQVQALANGGGYAGYGGLATPLAHNGWTDPLVPFGPGKPITPAAIDPLGPNGRPEPRRSDYPVSFNLPGNGDRLVPWTVLRQLADGVGIIRKCVEIRKKQITQLAWDFVPSESAFELLMLTQGATRAEQARAAAAAAGDPQARAEQRQTATRAAWERQWRADNAEEIIRLKRWWMKPDRINGMTWQDWTGAAMEEHLVLDALSVFPKQTLGGDLHSLIVVDGSCYSDDTEVLTRRGWVKFAQTTADDEFATRNPKTAALEWQHATYFHKAPHNGPMYHFASKTLDVLVTPNHRMLVTQAPRGVESERRDNGDSIVRADALAAKGNGQSSLIPMTSAWEGAYVSEFVLDAPEERMLYTLPNLRDVRAAAGFTQRGIGRAAGITHQTTFALEHGGRAKTSTVDALRAVLGDALVAEHAGSLAHGLRMSGDNFAAFMGMWLAEGSLASTDQVVISQMPQSKGFIAFRDLLADIFGAEVCHTGKNFVIGRRVLHDYLAQFGKAHEKYIPQIIKEMPREQLALFWHFYMLGDGWFSDGRQRVQTVSRRMADDLQEIAQKLGMSANVSTRIPTRDAVMGDGRVIKTESQRIRYNLSLSTTQARTWNVSQVEYDGDVYCVSVPNEVLYVRRNGKACWSGNTIKPLLDHQGNTPQPPNPSYQQILHGFPRGEFTATPGADGEYAADTLIYRPMLRRASTPYGFGPVERAIQDADLYMKRRLWMVSEYDDGVAPELLVNVDAAMTPQQLLDYERVFNDMLSGNIRERHRAKMLPKGFTPTLLPSLESRYTPDYDLFLIRMIGGAFDITAQELGFPPQGGLGGKGFDEGDEKRNERQALAPTAQWFASIVGDISTTWLGMPDALEFRFVGLDDDAEDEASETAAVQSGRKTLNESRDDAGLPRYDIPEADEPLIIVGNSVVPLRGVTDRANTVLALPAAPSASGDPGDQAGDDKDGPSESGAGSGSGPEEKPAPDPKPEAKVPAPRAAKSATADPEARGVVAAGLAVRCRSTGRVLMLQRALEPPSDGA